MHDNSGRGSPFTNYDYRELSDFFDRHDGVDLLKAGIMEIDRDHRDLDHILAEYRTQSDGS
jgi:hypothetical protein